jgi:hypothetical protein
LDVGFIEYGFYLTDRNTFFVKTFLASFYGQLTITKNNFFHIIIHIIFNIGQLPTNRLKVMTHIRPMNRK